MSRRAILSVASVIVSLLAEPVGTSAQSPPNPPQPGPQTTPAPPPPPQGSAPPACPPDAGRHAPTVGNGATTDLSKELSASGGVICPPANVDPSIRRSAPETGGTMPVIPPPGSPGGDPSVKPK